MRKLEWLLPPPLFNTAAYVPEKARYWKCPWCNHEYLPRIVPKLRWWRKLNGSIRGFAGQESTRVSPGIPLGGETDYGQIRRSEQRANNAGYRRPGPEGRVRRDGDNKLLRLKLYTKANIAASRELIETGISTPSHWFDLHHLAPAGAGVEFPVLKNVNKLEVGSINGIGGFVCCYPPPPALPPSPRQKTDPSASGGRRGRQITKQLFTSRHPRAARAAGAATLAGATQKITNMKSVVDALRGGL
ncbi:hypothetical protein EVAR_95077_1 [Eumeta japonica]|uniref:Uncharacterized protein n=1 Tax=Eumeta variegata TaxID=151549 RepID=A0A4C1W8Z3_EUMVA|nr:hypothetical protein EVAR_95077_1 [Eumeta japonica]